MECLTVKLAEIDISSAAMTVVMYLDKMKVI